MVVFLGKLIRRVGRVVRRAAPVLRQVARVAAPVVGVAAAVVLTRKYSRSRSPEAAGDREDGSSGSEPLA